MGFLPIPDGIIDKIKDTTDFIIVGHEKPDADCLSSQLALQSLFKRLGKNGILCSKGPFERVEIASISHLFHDIVSANMLKCQALVVILDCGSLERTGFSDQLADLPMMVIDHHSSGDAQGDFLYSDTFSPSTTLLVQRLIEKLAPPVTQYEAEHIFLGFATDTGYFCFLEQYHGAIFPYIGRLLDAGVAPRQQQRLLNGDQPFATRTLLGKLLLRVRSFYCDQLRITYELNSDLASKQQERDSPQLYNLLLSSSATEIVALLRQESEGWNISFRSHSGDVGKLAKELGGGGHKHASGCRLTVIELEDVIELVVKAAANTLAER